MKFVTVVLTVVISFILFQDSVVGFPATSPKEGDRLVLLHVLFNHGERTPDVKELYPKDPYANGPYAPFGWGQLTTTGKQTEFKIGQALFETYKDFLGTTYYPEIVDARTTDSDRTKMSLELVLSGLFKPSDEEVWNAELDWQPIPYNYLPTADDRELRAVYCPNYHKLFQEYDEAPEQQAVYEKYQELFDYISENTGSDIRNFESGYSIYSCLVSEEGWGLELPEWTAKVWPNNITDLAVKYLQEAAATTDFKKYAAGFLLQKLLDDTTSKMMVDPEEENGNRIYLYSGHNFNIAFLLMTLDIFDFPHIPSYGSYMVLEVHEIDGIYGIRIYYQNFEQDEPQLLTIPKCGSFCPLEDFKGIVQEYLPTDDVLCRDASKQ